MKLLFCIIFVALSIRAHAVQFDATGVEHLNTAGFGDNLTAPSAANDRKGNWVAVWRSTVNISGKGTDSDVVVSRSTDDAKTWTSPFPYHSSALTDGTAFDFDPRIASDDQGNWVTIWSSTNTLGNTIGTDLDLLFSRSTDLGATWSAPAALESYAATDSASLEYGGYDIAYGNGAWIVVWSAAGTPVNSATDHDILISRSTNGGATWSASTLLQNRFSSDTGGDWFPRIATDGIGNWVVTWISADPYNGAGTDQDAFGAYSSDNGLTWSGPVFVGSFAATDPTNAHDSVPVSITTDRKGQWIATWASDAPIGGSGLDPDIVVSRSSDNGASWSTALLASYAVGDFSTDGAPTVATNEAGEWVILWSANYNISGNGTDLDILMSSSVNNGASWSAPQTFNTNATSDSVHDRFPTLVTNPTSGVWMGMWEERVPSPSSLYNLRSRVDRDSVSPSVALTSNATIPQLGTFTVTATFSECVRQFAADDVQLINGTVSNFASGNAVYTFDVAPDADGLVTVSIPAGASADPSGNPCTASNVLEVGVGDPVPTPTPSPSPTATSSPTESLTPSPTESPTATPSPSLTPSETPSLTPSPSETPSPTASLTPSPTESPTATPSPSLTPSETPSLTPSPSETPSPTESLTPSPSESPTATPTPSLTPSETPSLTPSPSETPSPTESLTPSPTESPTATPTPSLTPSETPSLTPTPSETPSPTASLTPSPSESPTATPSLSPTPTPSPTISLSPTASPTAAPTASASPSPSPSVTANPTPSPSPSATPTATASPAPSASPSPTATPIPVSQQQVLRVLLGLDESPDAATLDAGDSDDSGYWDAADLFGKS